MLSGGERNRYALPRMLLHPSNFLLLDEPTNHLDLRAKDVLLEALKKYTGTVVFVSHDRYFIDKLATRVFEIGGGRVEIFPGNYEDYLWRKQGGTRAVPTLADVPGASAPTNGSSSDAAHPKPAPAVQPSNGGHAPAATPEAPRGKRLNPIKRKQMEDRVRELEEEIARFEASIAHWEAALQDFVSAADSQRQSQELDQAKASHAARLKEWEQLAAALQQAD